MILTRFFTLFRMTGKIKRCRRIRLLTGELGVSPRFLKVPQRMGDSQGVWIIDRPEHLQLKREVQEIPLLTGF